MENLREKLNTIIRNNNCDMEQLKFERLNTNEKITALYNSIQYVFEILDHAIVPETRKTALDSKKDKSINSIFLRIFCQIKSLAKLNEITDFQCMSFVARSILELYVDMLLISKGSIENSIEKYYSFQKVKLYKLSRNQSLSGYVDDKLSSESNPAKRYFNDNKDNIDDFVIKNWGQDKRNKPLYPDHWSGLDFYSRIQRLESEADLFSQLKSSYYNIVPYCNVYIHSDPSGFLYKSEAFYHVFVYNLYFNLTDMIASAVKFYCEYFNFEKTVPDYVQIINNLNLSNTYYLTLALISKFYNKND